MAARRRTEPSMDKDNPSLAQRLRPQIYVRLEFGVSWSPRHAPSHHEVAYKSRRMRERSPYFPRRVPASNTNFLAAPAVQHHQGRQQWDQTQHHRRHEPQPQIQQCQDVRWQQPEEPRRSRAESTSSHERRRSAPPPLGDNPWDVTVPQPQPAGFPPTSRPRGAAAATSTAQPPPPELWKDLPEVPSRFRLGEVGMPWTPWSWPMGHEPVAYPQDDAAPTHSGAEGNSTTNTYGSDELYAATPLATASVTAPPAAHFAPPAFPDDDGGGGGGGHPSEDPDRVRQLEKLSAAMMTVDNGFENQWWSQGPREPIADVDGSQPATQQAQSPQNCFSLGWAVASPQPRPAGETPTLSFSLDGIVSPVSDYASTTSAPHFCSLERTLSTRSEELFLH